MFKDVVGYEGYYLVNEEGIIKNVKTGKERPYQTVFTHGKNRLYVNLYKNGVEKRETVARIIAKAFIENPLNKPQINHKDGNPENNSLNNLEWVTCQENIIHAFENGLNNRKSYKTGSKPKGVIIRKENFVKEFESLGECAEWIDKENKKSLKSTLARACNKGYKTRGYEVNWKV